MGVVQGKGECSSSLRQTVRSDVFCLNQPYCEELITGVLRLVGQIGPQENLTAKSSPSSSPKRQVRPPLSPLPLFLSLPCSSPCPDPLTEALTNLYPFSF